MTSLEQKKIMITGAAGMLAADLIPRLHDAGASCICADLRADDDDAIQHLDITDEDAVQAFVDKVTPHWIVNCAAYTAVDRAEEEVELAERVNAEGPAVLARVCARTNIRLCHISTDYVFGGADGRASRDTPYTENDPRNPCGVYGSTKAHGEELIELLLPSAHLILRTSWLHGAHGPNFVAAISKLLTERDELAIVSDQHGCPTWTGWLADVIVAAISKDARGLYHACATEGITWYDFATEIARQRSAGTKLSTQTTEQLGRPAPRPRYSVLSTEKLLSELQVAPHDWRDGVRCHLAATNMVKRGD